MSRGLVRAAKVLGLTLALSVVLAALAPSAHADWTPRLNMLRWMNSARNDRDLARLDMTWELRKLANAHSKEMAGAGRIFHSASLGTTLRTVSWRLAGENVGVGKTMWTLYDAFMDSAPHRANILGGSFRRVGVGFYARDGFYWVTLIFVG
ncbi:MAG TPA: CAP domain-containing protein [Actinomycetota bacterium]|nr:CAP domain-containing protein [Actinomycetota bacterium]